MDVAGHAGHHLVPDGSERRNSDMSEGETNICSSYLCMFFLFCVIVCVIYIDTMSQHPDIPGMVVVSVISFIRQFQSEMCSTVL